MKRILTLSTLAIALIAATPHVFADRHNKKADPAGGGFWIGVACRPVDAELARELDIPEGKGMVIYHVIPGGPAARADLKKGDIILEADGKPVTDIADLKKIIEDSGGNKMPLLLTRDGKKKKMHITPARRIAARTRPHRDTGRYRLGIYCAPVSPALRDRLELGKNEGLVVEKVREDSPAAEAGISARDVLVKAGGRKLEHVGDLVAAVQKSKGGRLKIEMRRGGRKKTVTVCPEKVTDREIRRPERPERPERREGPTRYWLGVSCREAGETLRQQLRLGNSGLVVEETADDSPAGKAGITANDVLLEAGGRKLKKVADLVAAVGESGGNPLKISLIRGGRKKELEVKPGTRPPGFGFRSPEKPFPFRGRMGDPEQWKEWIEKMRPEDFKDKLRLRFFHPPTRMPGGKVKTPNLPKGVSVAITKSGDEPAKIVVRKGDKKWEVTEDNLDELPEDVRPHVARIMGGIHVSVGGSGGRVFDFAPNMKFHIRKRMDEARKKAEEHGEKRRENLEELKERIRAMQEEMRRKTDELRRSIEEMERHANE